MNHTEKAKIQVLLRVYICDLPWVGGPPTQTCKKTSFTPNRHIFL